MVASEDRLDEPELTLLQLRQDQIPLILDESQAGFTTAVFSENSATVIYTALTGDNPDDCEVRQAEVSGDNAGSHHCPRCTAVLGRGTALAHAHDVTCAGCGATVATL